MELSKTDLEDNLFHFEDEIFNMIQQLVKCYSLLQKYNISHRDVKLQNILLLNGLYKICNYG